MCFPTKLKSGSEKRILCPTCNDSFQPLFNFFFFFLSKTFPSLRLLSGNVGDSEVDLRHDGEVHLPVCARWGSLRARGQVLSGWKCTETKWKAKHFLWRVVLGFVCVCVCLFSSRKWTKTGTVSWPLKSSLRLARRFVFLQPGAVQIYRFYIFVVCFIVYRIPLTTQH